MKKSKGNEILHVPVEGAFAHCRGHLRRYAFGVLKTQPIGTGEENHLLNAPLLFLRGLVATLPNPPNTFKNMAASWYYKNGENVTGPCEPAQIKQAVNIGVITAATQVRQGEDGAWFPASQVPGLLSPPGFGEEVNVGQMTDKAYRVTKRFAEDSTWKTGLFRVAQLIIVALEVVFILYGVSCWMSTVPPMPEPPSAHATANEVATAIQSMLHHHAVIFFQKALGIVLLMSLVEAAVMIAILEIAISTGKMKDYLRYNS